MLGIDDALELVLARAQTLTPLTKLAEEALGLVLAEPITSDVDSPPHDKSIVDGYAIVAADATSAGAQLTILEEITAGAIPRRSISSGKSSRIMTGAPLPGGADAVVMVEKTELIDSDHVRILQQGVQSGQNIMRRASSLTQGQLVLTPGKELRAIELGLLHEVGRCEVLVHPRPRVAVLVTGNELVDAADIPEAGQIRNSNGALLAGLVRQAGGEAMLLGIGRDDASQLRSLVERGLACDVLVISGGVSTGVLDLVPAVLESVGVEQIFHKINLKPGKPLWFGVKTGSRSSGVNERTLAFGLPGNPVSSLVCFELFVRPAIARLMGRSGGLKRALARLTQPFEQYGDRTTMFPARIEEVVDNELTATPLDWRGSGDLRTLVDANGLIHFPVGERNYVPGDQVEVLLM